MMIPRMLVPRDCPLPAGPPPRPPRRLKTWLDGRHLIPQDMPVVPYDGNSAIPVHVPLDVLNNRVLVPRDLPVVPFPPELAARVEPSITALDDRVVVPQAAHIEPTTQSEPFAPEVLRDLVETDVLVSGEPRLLPEKQGRINWDLLAPAVSIVFHVLLILFILTLPGMLAPYITNPAQEAMNQQKLGYIFLPKNLREVPKPKPEPQKPSDKIRIDLGALKRLAPPKPEVSPQQGPVSQPAPHVQPPQPPPGVQTAENRPQTQPQPPKPKPELESVTRDNPTPTIPRPNMNPGALLQQSIRAAERHSQAPGYGFHDSIPAPPQLPGGPGQQGGPGPGYLSGSVQILTPTDGVDFTSYIARLLAIVKRNWEAVMPESVMLGDKGSVMLRFRILRNGDLPSGEPVLELTSGKTPLDRAAEAAITASNPFDPLPTAYTRPYLELRIVFLYNLPLPAQ